MMKILVVDDEIVSRTKMQTIMESLGECEAFSNGKEALTAFEKAMGSNLPFNLITLDIEMPEMDGTEVLHKIRAMEKERNIPNGKRAKILMVTAVSDKNSIVNCIQADCDDYIVKPFESKMIIDKVRKIVITGNQTKGHLTTMKHRQEINTMKEFHKGRVIFKEGEVANCAFKIKSGAVIIYRNVNNKNIILEKLKKGEIFGHMSVIPGERRKTNAMAAEYSELMVYEQNTLWDYLKNTPEFIQDLTKILIMRLNKTTQRVTEQPPSNVFIRICQILDLLYTLHLNLSVADIRKIPDHALGISYGDISTKLKDILQLSQLEIDQTLKRLHSINLIQFSGKKQTDKKGKTRTIQRFVKILDQNNFLIIAQRFYNEFKETVDSVLQNQEFFDIHDFARYVDSTHDMIYKKIAAEEIPDNIFYFHMTPASEWVKVVGKEFFKKAKKRRVKIEDLEGIDDIVHVDNHTVQEVLSEIGFYKVGILAAVANDEARDKIFRNLSSNVINIIKEEMPAEDAIDEIEAADIEGEFIDLIKEKKKRGNK
ncbi:MAG: response regulator [Proteobacteria bacterium]|nr:response regulator [Pseudomonadota bacterium]